jgi:hypothetical protein
MRKLSKILLLAISLVIGYNKSIFAQKSSQKVETSIRIETTIVSSIELITVKSITVGNLQPGQEEVYINPISDINSGYMIAVGAPGADFRLNFERTRTLTQVNGDGSLIFEYELSGNDLEDQNSAELVSEDFRNLKFNTEGQYHIWVGGTINLRNARPGNYDGDFTIEIEYI